jgi:N-acetylmuramoyl-L-alanine amidase
MGKTIYLSPSVQEKNVGAGNYGTEEKRMNQVADVVEQILSIHDIKVYRNKPDMDLSTIVKESNAKKVDAHLAIHSNAYNQKVRGCEVYCYRYGCEGEKLAKNIYDGLSKLTPTSDRGVRQGYNFYGSGKHLYEVTYTTAPAALVEVDFHDTIDGAKWIVDNITLIGKTLAKGVLDYFGLKYKYTLDTYHRVIAGSYKDVENAKRLKKELQKKGFESFILAVKL